MVRTGKLNISSQVKLLLEEDTANRQYGRLASRQDGALLVVRITVISRK